MPRTGELESWGHSTVQTACPLDCPDSCTLQITLEKGRIVEIDGGHENPSTRGYICGKVRRFAERVYGEDRLLYPAIRKGAKGDGVFTRVSWDEALDHIAERMIAIRDRSGGEAILPFCYGGSNGLLTHDTNDAALWRAFGTSRLARTVCAAPTGAANMGLYGKMPGVTYEDYVHARLIVLWGVNPSTSGIHLIPFIKEARKAGAQLVVVDPRATSLARQADLHIPLRPGTDVAVALALHKHLFDSGHADLPFLADHARGVDELRARAERWPMARAAEVAGVDAVRSRTVRRALRRQHAGSDPMRMGTRAQPQRRQRRRRRARAAGGGRKVRRARRRLLDEQLLGLRHQGRRVDERHPGTADAHRQHEQAGRRAARLPDPAVEMLFVYNCNPLATMPNQNRVLEGLRRNDLFTVVFEQVVTDTARFADVILPATTFVENYDIARGYGPISLQVVRPAIEPVGEARPNPEVFSELSQRLGIGEAEEETDTLHQDRGHGCRRTSAASCSSAAPRRRRSAAGRFSSSTSFR